MIERGGDPARDREPQTQTLVTTALGIPELAELPEDVLALVDRAPDDVTRLSWADTFGRAISADPQRPEGPATVLAMRPRASRSACGPIVRARQAVSAAIPTTLS